MVASVAAQLGLRTTLIESGKMGGDCLNYGCVPSKSLIAAGHSLAAPSALGLTDPLALAYPSAPFDHARKVIAAIAPHDSQERFEGLGARVIRHAAHFIGSRTVRVQGDDALHEDITARRIVIATGASPAIPPIKGLDQVPYLTNETFFELTAPPPHLLILGAGPIGAEMAQSQRALGARVTVLDIGPLLPREDPQAADVIRQAFARDGIDLIENTQIHKIDSSQESVTVHYGEGQCTTGSHLLVATGRKPNIENLNLETAGITYDKRAIAVNAKLQTSNKRIYAIGDVTGLAQFTHAAGYHAGLVIRHAFFRMPINVHAKPIPRVTYTNPEVAAVGDLSDGRTIQWPFAQNDRALCEGDDRGFIKIALGPRRRIKGALIVGARAGELLLPWSLAIDQRLPLSALAGVIAPYPTRSEISKRVAGSDYTAQLFGKTSRRLAQWLMRF